MSDSQILTIHRKPSRRHGHNVKNQPKRKVQHASLDLVWAAGKQDDRRHGHNVRNLPKKSSTCIGFSMSRVLGAGKGSASRSGLVPVLSTLSKGRAGPGSTHFCWPLALALRVRPIFAGPGPGSAWPQASRAGSGPTLTLQMFL